ncbi:putative nucleic acid-binding protein [Streptomyces sp. PvP037]|uniref:PIN domain nuclease n=1 Tax=Streptomyces sp. PvP037 TaxID=3156437 RepID=UPI003397C857
MRYLIDKSALARRAKPAVRGVLDPLIQRGLLAVTGVVEMEILYSARNPAEAEKLRYWLAGFDYLPCSDECWDRAKEVQAQATRTGNHRALSMADLLIAATAERHGVPVLHYDEDYEQIAKLTGQAHEWVAPAGTAD